MPPAVSILVLNFLYRLRWPFSYFLYQLSEHPSPRRRQLQVEVRGHRNLRPRSGVASTQYPAAPLEVRVTSAVPPLFTTR